MGIVKCEKNHFYDDVKYNECPHCKDEKENATNKLSSETDKTVAFYSGTSSRRSGSDGKTLSLYAEAERRKQLASIAVGGDERTVGIFSSKGNFYPVVGWLVCISGNEKGRDYRIISGQNFVGRSYSMDISIADDPEISREKHCVIIFDPKSLKYMVSPGDNFVYLNGEQLKGPSDLKAYDVITVGNTQLQFVPYCKEGVEWE